MLRKQLADLERTISKNPYESPENIKLKLPEARFNALVDYIEQLEERLRQLETRPKKKEKQDVKDVT